MKFSYKLMLAALFALVLAVPAQRAQAQAGDTLWVEWQDPSTGEVIINALRNAVANDADRPANRVYGLYRSGLYYNEDRIENSGFHLNIAGQKASQLPAGEEDFGPAVLQMVTREDGSVDQRMITGLGDITLRNLWITGQDDAGLTTAYTPIQVDASGGRFVFDNIIFERSDFALVQFTGANNDVTVTNSVFRNFINSNQKWEGRGIQFSAGADTVVVENNTFFNIGMSVIQSEAVPLNYIRFNHNTLVNIGRALNAGSIWKTAYFTNNIIVNGFWHGEDATDFDQPNRDDEYSGVFGVGDLPSEYGTNLGRRILFSNTAVWRDPAFAAYYADSIRAQPLFNETTSEYFADFDNMVAQDNFVDVNPNLAVYPGLEADGIITSMIQNIRDIRAGITPAASWLWDPGRDPNYYEGAGFVFPLPEDMTYTNNALLTAGTDDLPLGDLNWFPTAKETFEANKDAFVAEIEGMVAGVREVIVASQEAEAGTLAGDAEIENVEGQTFYTLNPGSAIEWTFDIEEEKEYALDFHVNLAGRETSGVDMILNGTPIFDERGWGQFVFEPALTGQPNNEWITMRFTQADLNANSDGALTLPTGENTLRIQASWAENTQWAQVDIVDPATGDVVASLTAPDAVSDRSTPSCGEGVEYCANGFQYVAIGDGSVSWNIDVPADGSHALRVFYSAPNGGTGEIQVDGQPVVPVVTFAADATDLLTSEFSVDAGVQTVTLDASGGLNVDRVQLIRIDRGTTSRERDVLPEGYALDQNFPNPFNPRTTISFTMAQPGSVTLTVYDILGRKVTTLVDGVMTTGQHQATWNGVDASGMPAASGVYLYRLETPVGAQSRTMVLLK